MQPMEYKHFVWPENPETYQIRAIRVPKYSINDLGDYVYDSLGPMSRVVSGTGVFRGEQAYENFNALMVLMANGVAGSLIHPIWGTMSAYLTELKMLGEGRQNYVEYSFTFRESGQDGAIPPLPSDFPS